MGIQALTVVIFLGVVWFIGLLDTLFDKGAGRVLGAIYAVVAVYLISTTDSWLIQGVAP